MGARGQCPRSSGQGQVACDMAHFEDGTGGDFAMVKCVSWTFVVILVESPTKLETRGHVRRLMVTPFGPPASLLQQPAGQSKLLSCSVSTSPWRRAGCAWWCQMG